jgi:hypothetical protein
MTMKPPFDAIRRVLDCSWHDEQRHFDECEADQQAGHIFK